MKQKTMSRNPLFIGHIVMMVKDVKETEKFYSVFLGQPDHVDDEQVAYQVGSNPSSFLGCPTAALNRTTKTIQASTIWRLESEHLMN